MYKSFLLFYNKNLFFLFYMINLQKYSHKLSIIHSFFIEIIFFHIFYYYCPNSYTVPPPYLTSQKHTLSLSFSPPPFCLLLSSSASTFFLLLLLFLLLFFLSSSSFSFLKKFLSLSPPLFLYQISALFKSEKKSKCMTRQGREKRKKKT